MPTWKDRTLKTRRIDVAYGNTIMEVGTCDHGLCDMFTKDKKGS
jgi:hypothetical protein